MLLIYTDFSAVSLKEIIGWLASIATGHQMNKKLKADE
jgi:hypothetical protein